MNGTTSKYCNCSVKKSVEDKDAIYDHATKGCKKCDEILLGSRRDENGQCTCPLGTNKEYGHSGRKSQCLPASTSGANKSSGGSNVEEQEQACKNYKGRVQWNAKNKECECTDSKNYKWNKEENQCDATQAFKNEQTKRRCDGINNAEMKNSSTCECKNGYEWEDATQVKCIEIYGGGTNCGSTRNSSGIICDCPSDKIWDPKSGTVGRCMPNSQASSASPVASGGDQAMAAALNAKAECKAIPTGKPQWINSKCECTEDGYAYSNGSCLAGPCKKPVGSFMKDGQCKCKDDEEIKYDGGEQKCMSKKTSSPAQKNSMQKEAVGDCVNGYQTVKVSYDNSGIPTKKPTEIIREVCNGSSGSGSMPCSNGTCSGEIKCKCGDTPAQSAQTTEPKPDAQPVAGQTAVAPAAKTFGDGRTGCEGNKNGIGQTCKCPSDKEWDDGLQKCKDTWETVLTKAQKCAADEIYAEFAEECRKCLNRGMVPDKDKMRCECPNGGKWNADKRECQNSTAPSAEQTASATKAAETQPAAAQPKASAAAPSNDFKNKCETSGGTYSLIVGKDNCNCSILFSKEDGVWDPKTEKCEACSTKLPGSTRNENGICACPKGMTDKSGRCEKNATSEQEEACKKYTGQVRWNETKGECECTNSADYIWNKEAKQCDTTQAFKDTQKKLFCKGIENAEFVLSSTCKCKNGYGWKDGVENTTCIKKGPSDDYGGGTNCRSARSDSGIICDCPSDKDWDPNSGTFGKCVPQKSSLPAQQAQSNSQKSEPVSQPATQASGGDQAMAAAPLKSDLSCKDDEEINYDGSEQRCVKKTVREAPNNDEKMTQAMASAKANKDKAQACAPNEYYSVSQAKCDTCSISDQVPKADKVGCMTCPDGEVPDKDGAKCISGAAKMKEQGCNAGQYFSKASKQCESCPSDSIPRSNFLGCDKCKEGEVPNSQGIKCIPIADRAQTAECKNNEFWTTRNGGKCDECHAGKVPRADKTGCADGASFKITYDLNWGKFTDGTKTSQTCVEGKPFKLASAPTKNNNEFLHWKYKNGNNAEAQPEQEVSCSMNLQIEAVWKDLKAEKNEQGKETCNTIENAEWGNILKKCKCKADYEWKDGKEGTECALNAKGEKKAEKQADKEKAECEKKNLHWDGLDNKCLSEEEFCRQTSRGAPKWENGACKCTESGYTWKNGVCLNAEDICTSSGSGAPKWEGSECKCASDGYVWGGSACNCADGYVMKGGSCQSDATPDEKEFVQKFNELTERYRAKIKALRGN
ncbi:MAG: hypothetical protein LBB08_01925 [Rickettsiales bacterium]|jgi:hypothetical protein|nr:hypothetical protein [Rickettsiales bacterium]